MVVLIPLPQCVSALVLGDELAGLGFDCPACGGKGVWGGRYVAHPGLLVSAGGRGEGDARHVWLQLCLQKGTFATPPQEKGSHGTDGLSMAVSALRSPRKRVRQSWALLCCV